MTLFTQLFLPDGSVYPFWHSPTGLRFAHDKRGPAECSFFYACTKKDATMLRNLTGIKRVAIDDGLVNVWSGRVEDLTIQKDGIAIKAFGYARSLSDLLYTGMWVVKSSRGWHEVTITDAPAVTTMVTERFLTDNNNRLYLATRKGATFEQGERGELSVAISHRGQNNITSFSADYSMLFPADWELRLIRMDDDFTNRTTVTTIIATGSLQTGSISQTFTGQPRIGITVVNNTETASSPAGEDGDNYAVLTNIRYASVSGDVSGSIIAQGLIDYVNTINSGQILSADITSTSLNLTDEDYEDARPAAILDDLAMRHGYRWKVDNNQIFHFAPSTSYQRTWYVDVQDYAITDSLEQIVTRMYSRYRDNRSRILRTTSEDAHVLRDQYGMVRMDYIDAQTTSSTVAESFRSFAIADKVAMQTPVAEISFTELKDEAGTPHPLYMIESGHKLIMRNLDIGITPESGYWDTFMVGRCEYDYETNSILVEPDTGQPTLLRIIANL